MVRAVDSALSTRRPLLIEAGTGTGKSFGYLLPAVRRVLEHDERVVVVTHTIALQEQLHDKDVPLIRSVVPDEFSAVLVKGATTTFHVVGWNAPSSVWTDFFRIQKRKKKWVRCLGGSISPPMAPAPILILPREVMSGIWCVPILEIAWGESALDMTPASINSLDDAWSQGNS